MESEPAWKDVKHLRPLAASPETHRKMAAVGRRDTPQEMAIRKALFQAGCRYRVQFRPLADHRWTADIAFTRARVLVFVDGCYWHGCPIHGSIPKSNGEWWTAKIGRNVERDCEATRVLTERGWTVLRIWSHEKPADAAQAVLQVLRRGPSRSQRSGSNVPPSPENS